jgi:hypothetical protein
MIELDLIEKFAAPAAAVLASLMALVVAWRLGRIQASFARNQTRIAIEALKHNLFEKRYGVYQAARSLISTTLSLPNTVEVSGDISRMFGVMDEATFLFPDDVAERCNDIKKSVSIVASMNNALANCPQDSESFHKFAECKQSELTKLTAVYDKLPAMFKRDLGFDKLLSR